jgi:alpha-amylase
MVYFCMAFHQHQPVGNFGHVIEHCYQQAYLPFLQVLERHPSIKVTLHYSGPLLKWIEQQHPEFFPLLDSMVERDQVEIMAGGFYEPILPILPQRDKLAQINKMLNYINTHFGYQARGLWLAERVWEPHLVVPIAQCGLEYIILDSSHLMEAGLEEQQLYGYYITEEEGYCLKVFPSSKKLRYIMPFAPPEETIDYLRQIAASGEGLLAQVGDDGEKFGCWPHTYRTVYEEGWLERLFSLLENNRDWLKVVTYSEYMDKHKPLGNIYLPTASYAEMMEWALPTKKRLAYEAASKQVEQDPRLEPCKAFLKGGFWRNFQVKYPESNNMHKKMLYVSHKIAQLEAQGNGFSQPLERAKDELQQGQCNCAFWHGVFGGLYLPHLRHAIYQHLIASELEVDRTRHPKNNWLEFEQLDLLKNGSTSLLVNTNIYNLYFNLDSGGSIYEWDYKPKRINLLNNFSRQYEAYHEEIRQRVGQQQTETAGPQSIHHIQNLKEQGLDHYLSYDWYRRSNLLDHFLAPDTNMINFMECSYRELGDFVNQPYGYTKNKRGKQLKLSLFRDGEVDGQALRIDKRIKLAGGSTLVDIEYQLQNRSPQPREFWFGVEFNLNPLYQDKEKTYFAGAGISGSLHDPLAAEEQKEWSLVVQDLGLKIELSNNQPAGVWCFPIYTVSQAESGYERVYQGSSILFHWRLKLDAGQSWQVGLTKQLSTLQAND